MIASRACARSRGGSGVCQPSAFARSASVERVRRASSWVTEPNATLRRAADPQPAGRCQLGTLAKRACGAGSHPPTAPRPRRGDGTEGVPLNVIQGQLGHADLGATSIYLQGIDDAEIIHAVHACRAPM